jgi:hypothetical protein
MSRGDWIQTASGRQFWPADPRPGDIYIEDIAHALSLLCRFGGHCLRFYSVAEHCVLLSRVAEAPFKKWALLHDGSEAYLLDVPTPLKPMLGGYKEAEARIMRAIEVRFNLFFGIPPAVKALDRAILMDERAQNMAPSAEPWANDVAALGVKLEFWTPARAEQEFLAAFYQLWGKE